MTSWFVEAAVAEPVAPPRRRAKPKPQRKPQPKPPSQPPSRNKPGSQPTPRPKPKARTRGHARSGIAWIVVGGVLLAGVVFVNVAVLRLNLALDQATQQRTKLHAGNARLQSDLASQRASPLIQTAARRAGLVEADPATITYINLGP